MENFENGWVEPFTTYTDNNVLNKAKDYFISMSPEVSIGLLIYNGEKFLRGAINSLLAQTFKNFEIIISDNCSTDNTQLICQEYARKYHNIHYLRQLKNKGPIFNYKFVLEQARGKFFMWASHDDLWDPEFISDCLNVFSNNPECVSVFCHLNVENLNTHTISEKISPSSSASVLPLVRVRSRLTEMIPNMIFGLHKTEIIRKVQIGAFDWFDIFILVQLSFYGKILIIPRYLYTAGTDGPRKPYSITGKLLDLSVFRYKISEFLKGKFSFRHRIPLMIYVYYVSITSQKNINKVIDNWRQNGTNES